jgi:hypothetical protein
VIDSRRTIIEKKVDEKISMTQEIKLKDYIKALKEDLSTLADFDYKV